MLPHHQATLLTPRMLHIARPSFLHCWLIIVVDCATCLQCVCQIWWTWECISANNKGTGSTQWWIPMWCSGGSPIFLACVLLPQRPYCINYSILEPALSGSISMRPSWVRPIIITGIHIMPPHLQQCYTSPKPHLHIRWYNSNPWLFDPFSTFSNKWNDH